MLSRLAALSVLEHAAAAARRYGMGAVVDRLRPVVARRFERFALDVLDVRLTGTTLAQLHYVRELREQGRERTFVELLRDAIPAGGTVLEGGAYIGYMTVNAAKAAGPGGRVIVFEPNASVHEVLCANLEANNVAERVTLVPKALGAEPGRVLLHGSEDTSSVVRGSGSTARLEVELVRGDSEVTGPVDVVKLDVEGSESAALRGLEGLFASRPPRTVFVECFPALLEAAGSSQEELVGLLRGLGYAVERIDERRGCLVPLTEPWDGDYANLRGVRR